MKRNPRAFFRQIYFLISAAVYLTPDSAFSSNRIYQKNSKFMRQPTFIEDLYQKNSVAISSIDTLTRTELRTLISRHDLEKGDIAVQTFRDPRFAIPEIYRIAEERIIENNVTSAEEKNKIRAEVFAEKLGVTDKQAIEGVALAVADSPPSKIMSIFLKLGDFKDYAPKVFLKSIHLESEELSKRKITASSEIQFQYSKIKISGAEFAQMLRYEISSETNQVQVYTKQGKQSQSIETILVAWEIDPLFKEDPEYRQDGVLINSGSFMIQPYIDKNGLVHADQSIILYHIYIKLEPSNYLMEIVQDLFKTSVVSNVLYDLATALRREAAE